MRRGRGVRVWQPDVERHNACFGAETNQDYQKNQGSYPFGQRVSRMPEGLERERPACLEEDQEGHDDKRRSKMRYDEVEKTCITHIRLLVFRHYEEIGQQ